MEDIERLAPMREAREQGASQRGRAFTPGARASAVRGEASSSASLVPQQTAVRAAHLTDLRAALEAVYEAANRTAPNWTDAPTSGSGTLVAATHVAEVRAAVLAIW